MVATRRRFNPNLQKVRVLLNGVAQRAYVCTKCLKAGKVQAVWPATARLCAPSNVAQMQHKDTWRSSPSSARSESIARRDRADRRPHRRRVLRRRRHGRQGSDAPLDAGQADAGHRRLGHAGRPADRPPRRRRVRAQPGRGRRDRALARRLRARAAHWASASPRSKCTSKTSEIRVTELERAKELGQAALATLEANRRRIDDLNVYPVPDGDTGTNLTLTARAIMEVLEASTAEDRATLAKELTRAALMGARGNSGDLLPDPPRRRRGARRRRPARCRHDPARVPRRQRRRLPRRPPPRRRDDAVRDPRARRGSRGSTQRGARARGALEEADRARGGRARPRPTSSRSCGRPESSTRAGPGCSRSSAASPPPSPASRFRTRRRRTPTRRASTPSTRSSPSTATAPSS